MPADRTTQTFWSSITSQSRMLSFGLFVQRMANRIQAGEVRYGAPQLRKQYKSRMEFEVAAYHKTGNMEHLLNIANYAWLESEKPQHKKFHFDTGADSATRDKFGV
jgi:hypothetical protein